ncbi:MAG: Gfo/Idh/MocA family oxidoreductase [Subdoligranulum variabile]|nr:Gfo/Idh/MocA family oxidoreductase [Subdoligranulum variabile]
MLTPLEYEGHAGLADDLIRAIDEDRPVLIDGEAGRATMELIMAVYKSAAEGRTVDLPLAKDDFFYTREGVQARMPHFYKKTGFWAKFAKDEIVLAGSNMK